MRRHPSDLTVLSFTQDQFQPSRRNCCAVPDWRTSFPEILWLCDTTYLTWLRSEITKAHAGLQLPQSSISRDTFNLHPVALCQLVARIGNPRLQDSIISQYNQTFRISIQATSGIDLGNRYVVSQREPPVRICKLRQNPVGLVEQYETAQTEQPLPNRLQKRCDSG